jgi:hypothetical protein
MLYKHYIHYDVVMLLSKNPHKSFQFLKFFQFITCCSRWNITILPPLSPTASNSPFSLNSIVDIKSASCTSSSTGPLTCDGYQSSRSPSLLLPRISKLKIL